MEEIRSLKMSGNLLDIFCSFFLAFFSFFSSFFNPFYSLIYFVLIASQSKQIPADQTEKNMSQNRPPKKKHTAAATGLNTARTQNIIP